MSDELLEEFLKPAYFKDDEVADTSHQAIYQTYSTDFGGPIDFDALNQKHDTPLVNTIFKEDFKIAPQTEYLQNVSTAFYGGPTDDMESTPFSESAAEGLAAVKDAIISGVKTAGDITVGAVEEAAGYVKSNPTDAALMALSMIPQARAARWGGKALSYAPTLAKNIGFLKKVPIINKAKSAANLGRTGIQVNLLGDMASDYYQHSLLFNPEEDLWDYLYRSDKDIQSAFYDTGYDFNTSNEQLDRTWDLLKYAHEKHGISIPMIYTEGSDKNEWTNPTYTAGFLGRAGNIHVLEDFTYGGKSVDYNTQILNEYLHHIRHETGGIFSVLGKTYDMIGALGVEMYLKKDPDREKYNARLSDDGKLMELYKLNKDGSFKLDSEGNKIPSNESYSHSFNIISEERIHDLYADELIRIGNLKDKDEREEAFDIFLNDIKEGADKEKGIGLGHIVPNIKLDKEFKENIMETLFPTLRK